MAQEFRDLLVETLPRMRGYAYMLTRSSAGADDLLQETAFRAIRAELQFTPGTNFKAWLYRILRNEYVSSVRRRKNIVCIDDVPEERLSQSGSQEDRVLTSEVLTAMGKLPLAQREVLMMVCAEGLSYEEAAEGVGCSVGTIKSRLWRARAALQQTFLGDEADVLATGSESLEDETAPRRRARAQAAGPQVSLS